jgi:hypothetical protein
MTNYWTWCLTLKIMTILLWIRGSGESIINKIKRISSVLCQFMTLIDGRWQIKYCVFGIARGITLTAKNTWQCHFAHYKCHIIWPGIDPEPSLWHDSRIQITGINILSKKTHLTSFKYLFVISSFFWHSCHRMYFPTKWKKLMNLKSQTSRGRV